MVFISHKKEDESSALTILNHFKKNDVPAWIDVLDPELKKKSEGEVTKHIQLQLSKCTHLLALFTINTKNSYWVPFELGMAYQLDKNIATIKLSDVEHPEYLNEFPILGNKMSDLDKFIFFCIKEKAL